MNAPIKTASKMLEEIVRELRKETFYDIHEEDVWEIIRLIEEYVGITHMSDCARHNAPAYEVGPCNCGAIQS